MAMIKKSFFNYRTQFLLIAFICSFSGNPAYTQEVDHRRPDFSLPDLDGKERSIAEWDGKAIIINFWATWCIPCKREIPLFNQIQTEYADWDLQVLGIAVDTPANVAEFLKSTSMVYPTLVEEQKSQEIAFAFSNSFLILPFTVFLDHHGRILWMQVEEIHREEIDSVLDRIWKIRSGELTYEQAQDGLIADMEKIVKARTLAQ